MASPTKDNSAISAEGLPAAAGRGAGELEKVVIEAIAISKTYGGTAALDRVDFRAYAGKVNVILGENGAGKSTLMKILAGEERPDSGRLLFHGEDVRFHSPRDARQRGIALIHQELSLCPALSVAENIFLGREFATRGLVRPREQERAASEILAHLDKRIDPRTPVGTLTVGQQQLVEIAKALADDVSVVIMDEPTSALSDQEVEALFVMIRALITTGVAVIYISHRMDEVFRIGDLLTVFRDGRLVASAAASDVDMDWIVENMLGHGQLEAIHELEGARNSRRSVRTDRIPAIEVNGVFLVDSRSDRLLLDDVALRVWPGEIVGVYGLLGAGKTELIETIAGKHRHALGTLRREARVIKNDRIHRSAAGIAMVPEDRQRDALIGKMSVSDNIVLTTLRTISSFGLIHPRRLTQAVAKAVDRIAIRANDVNAPVLSLSGGNQQKVVIARALLTQPKVLLLDEPTRGIDVGAKAEIFKLLRELAEGGLAIVFSSSDLIEVMSITDRIIVLAAGRVRGVFETAHVNARDIAAARARG